MIRYVNKLLLLLLLLFHLNRNTMNAAHKLQFRTFEVNSNL